MPDYPNIQPGPTHIFTCIFQMLRPNLTIFDIRKQQFVTNSATQKLNNNIHYDGTTKMNSNNVLLQQEGALSHTAKHHQIPAERKVTITSLRCGQHTVQT